MKKLFAAILALAMLPLVGCSKGSADEQKEPPSPTALASSIKENSKFDDELTQIDLDVAASLYSFNEDIVSDSSIFMGTGSTAEEIAVFTAVTEDNAKTLFAACEARIKDQIESYTNYVPTEIPKLESAIVKQSGLTVVLCVSADSDAAKTAIDEALK